MPWSLRLVVLLVLAGAGAFLWSKRPFVSDAEKVCKVAELSACPGPESPFVSDNCKIAWLERSMWSFGRLGAMPPGGDSAGGDFLRVAAREAGLAACPEADLIDRIFQEHRKAEEVKLAAAQAESDGGGETDEEPAQRRATGIVRIEAPAVDGELDPSLVAKEVRARMAVLKACYERGLKRNPKLAGKMKMRWTITAAGTVSGVGIEEDRMGDDEVASCIKGLVGRWRFPPPSSGTVDVVYPFVFQTERAR